MVDTTGGFTSAALQLEAETLVLPSLSQSEAIEIGEIAHQLGRDRGLAITIEVQLGKWSVFHIALPGTKPENDNWIARKARVFMQLVTQRCASGYLLKKIVLIGI